MYIPQTKYYIMLTLGGFSVQSHFLNYNNVAYFILLELQYYCNNIYILFMFFKILL